MANYDSDGNAFTSGDLLFSVGLHAAQVPEPGSLALLGMAWLSGMVASRRRQRA